MPMYYEINDNDTGDYTLLKDTVPSKNHSKKKPKMAQSKQSQQVNNFPMAWTCYKKNGKFICPMRGDKP